MQEKIIDKELINSKDLSKKNASNKKENDNDNDNDNLNQSNSKEKNIITVDLTNEEKIVFSQLGINPLIKLGKEYLTSNNFARLKESNIETEKPLDNKKTKTKQIKKISKSGEEMIKLKLKQMKILKINQQIKLMKIMKLYLQIKRMKLNLQMS